MANPYGVPSGLGPTGSNPYESSDMYGNPSGGNFYNTTPNTGSQPPTHSHGLGAWAPVAGAAVGGILGGLMGGGSDHGMGRYQGGEDTAAANQESLANQYRGLGGQQIGYLGQDQNAQRKATEDYANYLRQDPNTAGHNAQFLANQTAGTTGNYMRALAQLKAQSAALNGGSAGIGSAASSGTQGGLNYLTNGLAGNLAGAQANLYQQQQSNEQQRMQGLQDLYTGQTQQDYNMGRGFLGDASQGYSQVFQNYGSLYNQAAAQAAQEAANKNAQIQGLGSAISGAFAGGF